ncbi:MAG: response regulator transcription factor [Anaerolineae bacterium]|nr:response regulator transcription factor [Anaerolineae bacterium]
MSAPPPEINIPIADDANAIESERRRLADLLESDVVSPLKLLLAQANAYEQTMGANPQARLAVSVLANLARQALQQTRDLQDNLHPAVLETLGLEPALEALASQMMRVHGLQVHLALQRIAERLPHPLEWAVFRAMQDMAQRAVRHAHASHISLQLIFDGALLTVQFTDNGLPAGTDMLAAAERQITGLGGTFTIQPGEAFLVTIQFTMKPELSLTGREFEVIQLLVAGLSNKEIARALQVSARTVNFHLDNIYSKLGVNSRTEAAVYALGQGWAQPPDDLMK